MNLVKWIRKNQRKLITVFVVVIMVAFVGGQAFTALMKGLGKGGNTAAYLYYDNEKITGNDITDAQKKLNVLRALSADRLLTSMDYKSVLLTQLIFPNTISSVQLSDSLKQAVMKGQLNSSLKEIDTFFKQSSGRSELFWILLDAEAKKAGCVVSNREAKDTLKAVLPQLSQGRADAKTIIDSIINTYATPEEEVFRIFGDLMGITTYAQMITAGENVTVDQIKTSVARNSQELNGEFVKISAEKFVTDQAEPTEEELYQQFAKYKKFPAGQISDENPYGFGYSFPDRVKLEYLFISRSDVDSTVGEPTQQEMENYYRLNSDKYEYTEKLDRTDPDSESATRTKSYSEVSQTIKATIKREKTQVKADMIINEAIDMIDTQMTTLDFEDATIDQIESAAGNYSDAADKISSKYNIPVYSNTTGLLSASDIANDKTLGRLTLQGQSRMPVPIAKVMFAVDGTTELGRFEVPTPKMWENIGPIRGSRGYIVGVVRVTKTEKGFEPSDLSLTYDNRGVELKEEPAEKVYSIREQAAKDIKTQKAMETAVAKAEELSKMVAQKGWDDAVSEYNQNNPAGIVRIESIANKRGISKNELNVLDMLVKDDPSLNATIQRLLIENEQFAKLSAVIPAGETEASNTMAVVKFEAGKSCYVVKNVSRTPVTETDYLESKNQAAFQTESVSSESLGVIHYLPDNLFKRTSFRPAKEADEEPEETDSETAGAV